MKTYPWLLSTSAFALAISLAVNTKVEAQTAPRAGGEVSALAEIVVTARRREESLQSVPVAITAFSQEALKAKAISNAFDLDRAVPGLQVSAGSGVSGQPSFAIRGRGLNFGAAAGSVETYFADVPLSGPFQMPAMAPQYFDLQSLQVLKGPQGTLFGRSTTGGAVLFVPHPTSDQFGGYARVQFGDYRNIQLEGAINLPLIEDKAALRLAGFRWWRAGYAHTLESANFAQLGGPPYTDPFGNPVRRQSLENQDVEGLRATLTLRPTEGLQNTTIITYDRSENRSSPAAAIVAPTAPLGFLTQFYPHLLQLGPRTVATDLDLSRRPAQDLGVINTTSYELTPSLTLKNIFGYIKAKGVSNTSSDVDGSPFAGIDLPSLPRQNHTQQITDEFQVLGHFFDDRVTGIAGALLDQTGTPRGDDINIFTTGGGPAFGTLWTRNKNTAYGVFGSVTVKVTDQLKVTAGERHSWTKVGVFSIEAGAGSVAKRLANPNLTPGAAAAAGWTFVNPGQYLVSHFQGDTYNLGLEYQPSNDLLVYGGYRRGWKPGGFNAKPPAGLPAQAVFGPETDDDFYAGFKADFHLAGMPARLNAEAYYDTYKDKQVSYLTATTLGLATVTLNVPKTVYQGIDIETVFEPTSWLEVSANYAYIDAKFKKWPDTTYGATAILGPFAPPNLHLDLAKNHVAFVSPNKFSITPRFHTELPHDLGELSVAPTISYQDAWYATDTNVLLPQGETGFLLPTQPLFNQSTLGGAHISSQTLIDLNVSWRRMFGSRVNTALHLTNLTDKVYVTGSTGTLPFGVDARVYGAPRMISLDISTEF